MINISSNPQEWIEYFRSTLPEFGDTAVYSDEMILNNSKVAAKMVDPKVFGDITDYAVALLTAHNLCIMGQVNSNGTVNGNSDAMTNNKHVGSVSVSYDTPAGFDASNAFSATKYGRLWLYYVKLYGVGVIQL